MTTDSPPRQRPDQLVAERDRLRARLAELEAGAADLRLIADAVERRLATAREELAALAREAGGTEARLGPTGVGADPETFWRFPWPMTETPAVRAAGERLHAIRREGQPVLAAVGATTTALAACQAALEQLEQQIAQAEAAGDQDRAERLARWTAATTERALPDWQDQAEAVLDRLGLRTAP